MHAEYASTQGAFIISTLSSGLLASSSHANNHTTLFYTQIQTSRYNLSVILDIHPKDSNGSTSIGVSIDTVCCNYFNKTRMKRQYITSAEANGSR
jgi:hypothetical protein